MPHISILLKFLLMKKYLCAWYLLPVLLVAFSSTRAKAEDVIVEDDDDPNATITYITLKWDPNRERDLAGYNVYYARISGDYTFLETVHDPTAIIGVRGTRTVYFAVTAFDTSGLESLFSEEVRWP
jgi:hypothetical protein